MAMRVPAAGKRDSVTGALRRTVRAFALGAVILFSLDGVAAADMAEGRRALGAGDYTGAEKAWRPLAEAGDPNAQLAMGLLADLLNRHAEATDWYRHAARKGLSAAQVLLGQAYFEDGGDRAAAYCWVAKAVAKGHPKADLLLANIEAALSPDELARAKGLVEQGCP